MAYPNGVQTYQEAIRREDLIDVIADVSPDENPLVTMLGTTEASQTLHEWSDYFQARPSSNSKSIEGDDASFSDLSVATRKNNICQIIKQDFAVTETEIAVDKAGPRDAFARERQYALRRWKNQMEYAVIRGTKASGSSGVAREMDGLVAVIKTDGLATSRASGTSLSENEFNDMIQGSFDVTDGYIVDWILCTSKRKRDISNFTANNTRFVQADDKRLTKPVAIYESDFGVHTIKAHKDMPTNSVMGIRREMVKIAYLTNRKPKFVPLAQTGDAQKGQIVGEGTVEVMGARAMTYRDGYNLT